MESLQGRTAVVTGGGQRHRPGARRAASWPRACASCSPTSRPPALDDAAAELADGGARRARRAHRRHRPRLASRPCADAAYDALRRRATCCATTPASVRPPTAALGEHAERLALGPRRQRLRRANGVLAFVPRMIERGEEGHVVNTSSRRRWHRRHAERRGLRPARRRSPSPSACPASSEARARGSARRSSPVGRAAAHRASGPRTGTGPRTWTRERPLAPGHDRRGAREPMADQGLRAAVAGPRRAAARVVDGILADGFWLLIGRADRTTRCTARARGDHRRRSPTSTKPASEELTDRATATSSSRPTATPARPREAYRDYLDPAFRDALRRPPGRAAARIARVILAVGVRGRRQVPRGVGGGDRRRRAATPPTTPTPATSVLDTRGRRRRGAVPRRRRARHRPRRPARRSAPGLGAPARLRRRAGHGRRPGPQPLARRLLRRQPPQRRIGVAVVPDHRRRRRRGRRDPRGRRAAACGA